MKKAKRAVVSLLLAAAVCVTGFPYGQLRIAAEDSSGLQAPDPPYVEGAQDWSGYTPISSKQELMMIRFNPAGQYYLTEDIILDPADFEEGGMFFQSWQGEYFCLAEEFTGTLDGNGRSITGLRFSGGLFGNNRGTIRNLRLLEAEVSGELNEWIGAMACTNYGVIEGCLVTGTVFANFNGAVGGLVGLNEGSISQCVNGAKVEASALCGGIAGRTEGGSITLCANWGTVFTQMGQTAAGICGESMGTISRCANLGEITGLSDSNTRAIGIAGGSGSMENCYNSGQVKGDYAAGIGDKEAFIANCYNAGTVTAFEREQSPEDPGDTEGPDEQSPTGRRTLWGDGFPAGTRPSGTVSAGTGQTTRTAVATSKGASTQPSAFSQQTQPSFGQPEGGEAAYAVGENCKNSYYLDTLPRGGGDSRPLTAAQMKQADSFEGFDFGTVWKMGDTAYPFPVLQGLSGENPRILLGVAMIAPPDSTLAYQGEQPDLTGMLLVAQYSDGSEEKIGDYTVEGCDPYRLGGQPALSATGTG